MTVILLENKKGRIKISHLLLAPMICFYWFFLNIIVLVVNMDKIENSIPKSGYGRIVIDFKARAFIAELKTFVLLIIIFIVFLLVSIHKRKSRTKLMFIFFFIGSPLFFLYLLNKIPKASLTGAKYSFMVVYIFLSCIWIFYFMFSKRVKHTFNQTKKKTAFKHAESYKVQKNFVNSGIPDRNANLNHSEPKKIPQTKISNWNDQYPTEKKETENKIHAKTSPITLNHSFKSRSSFYVKKKQRKIPSWMIMLAIPTLILAICFIFFNNSSSKSSADFSNNALSPTLKFNDFEVELIREKTKKIKSEIFMEHTLNTKSEFTKEILGICYCNNQKDFLRLLETDENELSKKIPPCIPFFVKPKIISPVLKWFSNSTIKNGAYISSLLQTQLVYYGDKAVDEIVLSLKLYDNDRVKSLLTKSLSLIGTKKSISHLVEILNGENNRTFHYAAQNIQTIVTNKNISLSEAFNLVKTVYEHPDPIIQRVAIKAMILFKGKAPYDLLLNAKQDPDDRIHDTSMEILKKFLERNPELIQEHYESLDKSFISSDKGVTIDTRLIGSWEMDDSEIMGYPYYFITFYSDGKWERKTEYVNKRWKEDNRNMCTTKILNNSGTWRFIGPPLESMTKIQTKGKFMVEGFPDVHNISIIDEETIGLAILEKEIGSQTTPLLYSHMELSKTKFLKVTPDYIKKKIASFHSKLGIRIFRPINKN